MPPSRSSRYSSGQAASVHWARVLADVANALGSAVGEPLARQLGVPCVALRCWLAGAEPAPRDRDMLLSRWRVLTCRPMEFVPRVTVARASALPASVAVEHPALASPLLGPLAGQVPQPLGLAASVVQRLRGANGAWLPAGDLRQDAHRPDVLYTPQEVGSYLVKLQARRLVQCDGGPKPMRYRWAAPAGARVRLHFRVRTAT